MRTGKALFAVSVILSLSAAAVEWRSSFVSASNPQLNCFADCRCNAARTACVSSSGCGSCRCINQMGVYVCVD